MPRRVTGPGQPHVRRVTAKGGSEAGPTALAAPPRKRLRRVLIATDFSCSAKAALERTALLPLDPQAEIILLHVLPEAVRIGGREETQARGQLGEAERYLIRLLQQAAVSTVQVQAETPESGTVAEMAVRLFPPATGAATVVHAYEVPFEGYTRIGGASDASIRRERNAAAKRAKTALVKVVRPLTESGVEPKVLVRHGDARLVILQTLHRLRSDLVTVGTHGRTGITHYLLGSVAQEVVRSARCDVLVVRTPHVVVLPP